MSRTRDVLLVLHSKLGAPNVDGIHARIVGHSDADWAFGEVTHGSGCVVPNWGAELQVSQSHTVVL